MCVCLLIGEGSILTHITTSQWRSQGEFIRILDVHHSCLFCWHFLAPVSTQAEKAPEPGEFVEMEEEALQKSSEVNILNKCPPLFFFQGFLYQVFKVAVIFMVVLLFLLWLLRDLGQSCYLNFISSFYFSPGKLWAEWRWFGPHLCCSWIYAQESLMVGLGGPEEVWEQSWAFW